MPGIFCNPAPGGKVVRFWRRSGEYGSLFPGRPGGLPLREGRSRRERIYPFRVGVRHAECINAFPTGNVSNLSRRDSTTARQDNFTRRQPDFTVARQFHAAAGCISPGDTVPPDTPLYCAPLLSGRSLPSVFLPRLTSRVRNEFAPGHACGKIHNFGEDICLLMCYTGIIYDDTRRRFL